MMKLMVVFFIEKKVYGNFLKTQLEITSGYHQRDTTVQTPEEEVLQEAEVCCMGSIITPDEVKLCCEIMFNSRRDQHKLIVVT